MKSVFHNLMLTTPIALLLLHATPSLAAIDEQGAQNLKSLIQNYIQEQQTLSSTDGVELKTQGDLTISPKDTYYQVSLPHLKAQYPDNRIVDLGIITMNAMPGKTGDEWNVSIALPKKITSTSSTGAITDIKIGHQKTSGIWNVPLNYMTKYNAEYQNIDIATPAEDKSPPFKTTINLLNIDQNFTENTATHTWSGPLNVIAKNVYFGKNEKEKLTLGEANIKYQIFDLDMTSLKTFQKNIKEAQGNKTNFTNIGNNPMQILQIYDVIANNFETPMGAITSNLTIKNLEIYGLKVSTEQPENLPFKLASAHFGFDADMHAPQNVKTNIRFGFSDLKTPFEDTKNLTPDSIDLDIKIGNIPLQDIIANGRKQIGILSATQAGDKEPQEKTPEPVKPFSKILGDAGTNANHKFHINTPLINAKGEGTVRATSTNPIGIASDQTWEITGLNALIAELNSKSASNPMGQNVTGPLVILQMAGQISPDNPDTRTYHLVMSDQGNITINGADFSALMGGAPPPQ
ncbi:MAG TPA: hypothetical protein PLE43_02715 [Alphaproteobacteria bacterium]|nr:hypothetical protein [Alphaproteobacteria bacterium]